MDQHIPLSLSDFLAQLLVEKHGEGLSADNASQMQADLLPKLERFITLKIMTALGQSNKDDLESFMQMMEAKKPMEEVQKFVDSKIPNGSQLIAQALLEFQNIYLGAQPAPIGT